MDIATFVISSTTIEPCAVPEAHAVHARRQQSGKVERTRTCDGLALDVGICRCPDEDDDGFSKVL